MRTIKVTFANEQGEVLDTCELEIEDPNVSKIILCGVPAAIDIASPRSQLDHVYIGTEAVTSQECPGHCDDLTGPAGITTYCDGSCRH